MGPVARAGGFVLFASLLGAGGCCPSAPADGTKARPPPEHSQGQSKDAELETVVNLLEIVSDCVVRHRGVLLDLGSDVSRAWYGTDLTGAPSLANVWREGSDWIRVDQSMLSVDFVFSESSPVFVQARLRGLGARSATVRIDGKDWGTLRWPREEVRVVDTAPSDHNLDPGRHLLTLQFHGSRRDQPRAEIDWVRIGIPDENASAYAAPTRRDLEVDALLEGKPTRALGLRAPGSVGCVVGPTEGMRLQTRIGYLGLGEGEAQVHVAAPNHSPELLASAKIGGEGASSTWVDVSLDRYVGEAVQIEFSATQSDPGGIVLFAEPALRAPALKVPTRTRASAAVLLILSSTNRQQLPPYAEVPALSSLTDLAASSTVFHELRGPTTLSAGSVASMITGLWPTSHQVVDSGARLSERVPTIATTARDARVATAMFTANPSTFAAFGFHHGWSQFESFSPVSGLPAHSPLLAATRWLEQQLKDRSRDQVLLLIHARGAHPPWTATAEEVRSLPPQEYAGTIDGRRGAQQLANMRSQRRNRGRGLKADDRERVDGFSALALAAEDQALGHLIELFRRAGLWESTLLIVTSDVATESASRIPFGDAEPLSEELLGLPLIVHFPQRQFAGESVRAPAIVQDIGVTLLAALGLRPPELSQGTNLLDIAAGPNRWLLRKQYATLGLSYATRWGSLVLLGNSPQPPLLCDLSESERCETAAQDRLPFVAAHLWQSTFRHYQQARDGRGRIVDREPATLDPETLAALTVWGSLEAR